MKNGYKFLKEIYTHFFINIKHWTVVKSSPSEISLNIN